MSTDPTPPFTHSPSYKLTQSPDHNWKPGDGLGNSTDSAREWRADEAQGWKVVDPDQTDKMDLYRLMTSGIVPRPIAFVSSLSIDEIPNLSPFSQNFKSQLTHSPPLLMFSMSTTAKGEKDTASNIRHTKEFTVNIISYPWADAANFASIDAPPDASEWVASGLTMEKSTKVKPAWVRESAFAMECELHQIIDIPNPTPPSVEDGSPPKIVQNIVIGLVKLIHVRNAVIKPTGAIDPARLKPLLRLGGISYATLGEGFDIRRPRWSDHQNTIRELENKHIGK
ncbi:hypothetical protein BD410DRAFT_814872 [Rickenella mellea]|uniref:Flavin reductase like domain-containing protein n=1 Tax=Rickenella mellea TaxID=50990 RepID=A0A4Y7Q4C2_9AGAM|nr:hypothetical protein BD410DRAFT_814872 [Rickenella mellea]